MSSSTWWPECRIKGKWLYSAPKDGRRLHSQPRLHRGDGSKWWRSVRFPQDRNICLVRPTDPVHWRPSSNGLLPLPSAARGGLGCSERTEIELLTNMLAFRATTIAAIHKDRWETEFFSRRSSRISR